MAAGELRVHAPRPPEGALNGPEQAFLELIGALDVQLLVGGAQGRERNSYLLGRLSQRVEQLLAGLGGGLHCVSLPSSPFRGQARPLMAAPSTPAACCSR